MFTDRLMNGTYQDIWSDEEKRSVDESWWGKQTPYKDPNQTEMEFLWPHNAIQLELDLDKPKQPKDNLFVPYANTGLTFTGVNQSWVTTTINSSQLEINIADSVGELKIGGMSVGLKEQPKWYQRVLYKLLGFNWKDK
jgi:hypothetical protein